MTLRSDSTERQTRVTANHGSRLTKHSLPDRPPVLLRRQRLLDFLHQNINRKLVLVAAAAGYGKTSLVVDFARDTDFPVAWCALDETDRDLTVLAADLVAAMRGPFPNFGEALQALLGESGRPAHVEQLASAFARGIESSIDGYFVLCLDDYHVVEDVESVGRFFTKLLEVLPEQAHLLIASRTIPPFPIAPLAARQEIAGLSEEQLRFTPAEVQALLRLRNDVAVPDSEAEQLTADAEGWITGILLTSHLMWQGLVATWLRARQADAPVYDYLADEVLAGQPAPLRQFLLESAVLPEMDAESCDAVLGRRDSADMLRQAEAQRLFISGIGDEHRAFRYHHLFREFLLARLKSAAPARLREIQKRAGQWYESQGWPETAITFYLAASDTRRAVAIAETNAEAMFIGGRHETLRRWGDQLVVVALEAPTLHFFLSRIHTDAGELAAAVKPLEVAEAGYKRQRDSRGIVSVDVMRCILAYRQGKYDEALTVAQDAGPRAQHLGRPALAAKAERFAGLCYFALGNLASAESLLERAAHLFEETQNRYDWAWALHDLARVLRANGQTARAALAQQRALAIWREAGNLGPLAMALNNFGWDQHMLGQYEAALATYTEALDRARQTGSGPAEILVLAGQGDLLAELGDRNTAAELYRRAIGLAESLGEIGFLAYLFRALARLERWSGNYLGALEWLRRAELAPASSQANSPGSNSQSMRGAILLEMGHAEDALALLDQTCAELEQAGAIVDLAQGRLTLARAQFRCGREAEAFASLRQAFTLAEQVGYDQMLVAEALAARDVLESARAAPGIGLKATALIGRAEAAQAVLTHIRARSEPILASRPPTIEVRALGGSRVLREGAEIAPGDWASQQARELFLYLVEAAPVRREHILEIFWPDTTSARATANFHGVLHRLRRAVGRDVVVFHAERGEYRLSPGLEIAYDADRFERSARAALAIAADDPRRAASLAAAIELYGGDYLADLPVEWALERRRALCDLYVEVLCESADQLMRLTRYAEARQTLARALAREPLRDDLHSLMLRCLAAMGRRHEVVEHYQRYRQTLRAELGLDPPAESRALYARLIE